MTPAAFRQIALGLPEAVESEHMGHPDFRVQGKIFATLFTREGKEYGMVKLTPPQQRVFLDAKPAAYQPIPGGWGRKGGTQVLLGKADQKSLKDALFTAWCNAASKALIGKLEADDDGGRRSSPQ